MYNNHLTAARNSVENFESIEKVLDTCVDSISDYLDKQLGNVHHPLSVQNPLKMSSDSEPNERLFCYGQFDLRRSPSILGEKILRGHASPQH